MASWRRRLTALRRPKALQIGSLHSQLRGVVCIPSGAPVEKAGILKTGVRCILAQAEEVKQRYAQQDEAIALRLECSNLREANATLEYDLVRGDSLSFFRTIWRCLQAIH